MENRKTKLPRVVIVTPLGPGGAGGIDRVVDMIRSELKAAPLAEVEFVTSRGKHIFLSPAYTIFVCLRIIFLRISRRLDLVHINLSADASTYRKLVIAAACRTVGAPYVVHLHSGRFMKFWDASCGPLRWCIKSLFVHASRTIVLGEIWRKLLHARVPDISARTDILFNASAPIARRASGDILKILFLGRIGSAKGTPLLIEALSRISSDGNWHATLAGDGDVAGALATARTLGLAERISFPGWVGPEEVTCLLGESDILVLPSREENLPMSVVEGLGAGLAVVATPVGAVSEIVDHERSGLLVPVDDVAALADALRRLVTTPSLREELGAAGRKFHSSHLNSHDYLPRLVNIWRRAVDMT